MIPQNLRKIWNAYISSSYSISVMEGNAIEALSCNRKMFKEMAGLIIIYLSIIVNLHMKNRIFVTIIMEFIILTHFIFLFLK